MGPKEEFVSKRLDEELADHLEKVFEKNKDYKYTDGLTEDNWEKEIKGIPLFCRNEPTQEDIDNSVDLQALQALKYECDDPHEYATAHKDDGNYHFKRKDYKKAILAYTEAVKQTHEDSLLYAVLYTNRAAANFYLGNNRTALNDATQALKHKPDHMKALLRCATSCFDLEKYDDCVTWCDTGLKIDETEKKLIDLKKKSAHQKKQQERDTRKNDMRERKTNNKQQQLIDAIQERRINIESSSGRMSKSQAVERLVLRDNGSPHNGKLYLDQNNMLHWPVYFLYPQYSKSDFIEDFNENNTFEDHVGLMFGEGYVPEWDKQQQYVPQNIEVYFEDQERNKLILVDGTLTLREVLSDKRYRIQTGCPAFTILSRTSEYYKNLKSLNNAEKFIKTWNNFLA